MATSRWTNAVGDGSKKVRYWWCGIWRRGEHWWLLIGYIYVRFHSSNLATTWQFVSRYVYLRRYEQRNAPSLSSPISIRWNLSSKCTLLFQRRTVGQSRRLTDRGLQLVTGVCERDDCANVPYSKLQHIARRRIYSGINTTCCHDRENRT